VIKDRRSWEEWEAEYRRKEAPDFLRNLKLVEAMYEEARSLGLFPLAHPLEGLDVKIRMARIIGVSAASGKNCPRP
jgi:hypothetical protein